MWNFTKSYMLFVITIQFRVEVQEKNNFGLCLFGNNLFSLKLKCAKVHLYFEKWGFKKLYIKAKKQKASL